MDEEKFNYLAIWCAKNKCALSLDGQVGFGRDCVGVMRGNNYVDYGHVFQMYPGLEFWYPPDAYHKHNCLAVLGHGAEAEEQLYKWIKWLDTNNWIVDEVLRDYENMDMLTLAMHGPTLPRLVKKEIDNATHS